MQPSSGVPPQPSPQEGGRCNPTREAKQSNAKRDNQIATKSTHPKTSYARIGVMIVEVTVGSPHPVFFG